MTPRVRTLSCLRPVATEAIGRLPFQPGIGRFGKIRSMLKLRSPTFCEETVRCILFVQVITIFFLSCKPRTLPGPDSRGPNPGETSSLSQAKSDPQEERPTTGGEGLPGYLRPAAPYANWAPGEPDGRLTNEDCVQVDRRGYWSDTPCDPALRASIVRRACRNGMDLSWRLVVSPRCPKGSRFSRPLDEQDNQALAAALPGTGNQQALIHVHRATAGGSGFVFGTESP